MSVARVRTGLSVVAMSAVLGAVGISAARQSPTPPFAGVWKVTSSTTENGGTISPAQPGLWTFTASHYSFVQVTSATPRPEVAIRPDTPIVDVMNMFGPVFQAQAGTYTVAGNALTLRPMVAKSPALTTSGTPQPYTWKLAGTTLQLTGPIGPGARTYTLTRAE